MCTFDDIFYRESCVNHKFIKFWSIVQMAIFSTQIEILMVTVLYEKIFFFQYRPNKHIPVFKKSIATSTIDLVTLLHWDFIPMIIDSQLISLSFTSMKNMEKSCLLPVNTFQVYNAIILTVIIRPVWINEDTMNISNADSKITNLKLKL